MYGSSRCTQLCFDVAIEGTGQSIGQEGQRRRWVKSEHEEFETVLPVRRSSILSELCRAISLTLISGCTRYLAVGGTSKGSKVIGAGRLEATNAREWKLEALADLCEDHTFDHAVCSSSRLTRVAFADRERTWHRSFSPLPLKTSKLSNTSSVVELSKLMHSYVPILSPSSSLELTDLAKTQHQDLSSSARSQVIAKFRSSASSRPGVSPKRVLVIYDALSRNLSDVGQAGLVINFDLPRQVEDYIHRYVVPLSPIQDLELIDRGNRRISCASTSTSNFNNKNSSMILNIVTPNDVDMLRGIESFYRCKIMELPPNFATSNNTN